MRAFLDAAPPASVVALQWLARWRGGLPPHLLRPVLPLLADHALPASVRFSAAARVLKCLPDTPAAIRPVVRALTAGLSPLRALHRVRELQDVLVQTRALDEWIERKEHRLHLVCPRCGLRTRWRAMLLHLWHEHATTFEQGGLSTLSNRMQRHKHSYTAENDPAGIDRGWATLAAVDAAAEPMTAYREWLADGDPTAAELAPLADRAAVSGSGLCPVCFAEVPAALTPLLEPLAVGHGRIAGEGYAVEVGTCRWLRTLRIETPEGTLRRGPDRKHAAGPRSAAVLVSLPIAILVLLASATVPPSAMSPLSVVMALTAALVLIYFSVAGTRKPVPRPLPRAFDAAWTVLVPA